MYKDDIFNLVNEIYNNSINETNLISIQSNIGGKIRSINGNLVETMTFHIIEKLFEYYNIERFDNNKFKSLKIKDTNKIYDSINNKYLLHNGKNSPIKIVSNINENNYIKTSVDVHIHYNNKSLYIEDKSYLDLSFMKRTVSDFTDLKTINNSMCIIITLEDAINNIAYNFFMDSKKINYVFFLLGRTFKRRSENPIWKKEFYKPLVKEEVINLIDCIENYFFN
jgi:hypothetical protein